MTGSAAGRDRTYDQQLSGSRSVDRKVTGFSGKTQSAFKAVALPTEPRRLVLGESPLDAILTLLFVSSKSQKVGYLNIPDFIVAI